MRNPQLKTKFFIATALLIVVFACAAGVRAASRHPAARATETQTPAVMTAMQDELSRSMAALGSADPSVYYLSYTVTDRQFVNVSGSNGALLNSGEDRGRWLEVQSR